MNLKAWAVAGYVVFAQGAVANTLNDGATPGAFGNPNPNTTSPGGVLLAIFDAADANSPNAGKTLLVNTRWSYADLVNGVAVNPVDLSADPNFKAIQNDPLRYNVVAGYGLYQNPDTGKSNLAKDGAELPFDDDVPNNAAWGIVTSGHAADAFSQDVNDLNAALANGIQIYWTSVNTALAGAGATEDSGPDTVLVGPGDSAEWDIAWNGNFGGTALGVDQNANAVDGVGEIAKLFWITNPSFSDPTTPNSIGVLGTLQLSAEGRLSYTATAANHAPTADAGTAQTVSEGATVTLDGSASGDPDQGQTEQLTYQWSAPAGVTLSDATAKRPSFTAPVADGDRVYRFGLVVTDPAGSASAAATVAITVQHLSNHAPTAKIATPPVGKEGDTVRLDGSPSSDPDAGQTASLAYRWTAPAGIVLDDAKAQKPSFVAPKAETDRTYGFSLVVTDAQGAGSPVATAIVTVLHINRAPTANAGAAQTVDEAATVTLDGSASGDPDKGQTASLNYQWTAPAGIALSDGKAKNPTFTAPAAEADTRYVFTLVVTDANGLASAPATVNIVVKHRNRAPTANAGRTQAAGEGDTVTLDGSASSDPDQGQTASLSYLWTAPAGIALSDPATRNPSFVAPAALGDKSYEFSLVVKDASGAESAASTVAVAVKHRNRAPVVNAGGNQNVNQGAVVALNGSASADPEGDSLVYHWSQESGPIAVTLGGADSAAASFLAGKAGDYAFKLTATDPQGLSATQTVAVAVATPVNHTPTASATAPAQVEVGAVVALDGSASADPDAGDSLSYAWTQVSGPTITLSSDATDRPIFIAGDSGTYGFKLAVTDGSGAVAETSVQVAVATSGPGIAWTEAPANWRVGQAQTLRFQGDGLKDKAIAKLRFSKDGGRFVNLGKATVAKGSYRWKPARKHIAGQGILQVCAPVAKGQQVCATAVVAVTTGD